MNEPVLLVLGLIISIGLAVVSRRFQVPYPIVFIVAGTALAFVPGLPPVHISPDWIFLAILPPLLFSSGWSTDWVIFRRNLRPILQLAIGLVIVTTLAVAALTRELLPALSLASAFALGAIVSPTDAVAAGATFARFAIPRRIIAIVEGEGLVNDATALVIYGYAVAAAGAATFSLSAAARSFVFVALGGIAIGLAVAWFVEYISRLLERYDLTDSLIDNLLLIGAPYFAYLSGQAAHVSGILAVAIAGILLSRRSTAVYSPQTRLIAQNVWTLWIYVLNAFIFLAIGLQLRTFVHSGSRFLPLLPAALAISVLVILVRMAYVFPTAWIARLIPAVRIRDPLPPAGAIALIGWTGMRGIVSLAAALALPYNFPNRDTIVFITFVVIFITLVGQGLTLDPALRFLRLREGSDERKREVQIRLQALDAGLDRIRAMQDDTDDPHVQSDLARLRGEYESRIEHLRDPGSDETDESTSADLHTYAEREALRAERNAVAELRDRGEIPDEAFRRIQYDLDLAESRLH